MPRKPRNATRPSDESDTLPDRFCLNIDRIPGGWSVYFALGKPPSIGTGSLGLLTAITGALKALARGGK